jgi:hypothetical protein
MREPPIRPVRNRPTPIVKRRRRTVGRVRAISTASVMYSAIAIIEWPLGNDSPPGGSSWVTTVGRGRS